MFDLGYPPSGRSTHDPTLGDLDAVVDRDLLPRLLRLDGFGDDRVELLVGQQGARAHGLLLVGPDRGLDVDVYRHAC